MLSRASIDTFVPFTLHFKRTNMGTRATIRMTDDADRQQTINKKAFLMGFLNVHACSSMRVKESYAREC